MRKTENGSFMEERGSAKERFKDGLNTGHAKLFIVAFVIMLGFTIVSIVIK